jgi:hypothetical protein
MPQFKITYIADVPEGALYPRVILADDPYEDVGSIFTFNRTVAGEEDWIQIPKRIVRRIERTG